MNVNVSLEKYAKGKMSLILSNEDYMFTEELIRKNINIMNLLFKIYVCKTDKIDMVIRSKYIPRYIPISNTKVIELRHEFEAIRVNIDDLDDAFLYKVYVEIVEKSDKVNVMPDIVLKTSKELFVNTKKGLITNEKIEELYKEIYSKKMFSQSEKDSIKVINNEIEFQELEELIDIKKIKNYTFENRGYDNINNFMNSKQKFSKLMTEDRKKKVIYSTNAKLYFEEKMMKNNKDVNKNPFLKNEWFMGPVYSYDKNYKKFI